eukprot:746501-Hanusia_phi.AAC.5
MEEATRLKEMACARSATGLKAPQWMLYVEALEGEQGGVVQEDDIGAASQGECQDGRQGRAAASLQGRPARCRESRGSRESERSRQQSGRGKLM